MTELTLYNAACRAIAEAVRVDEAKDILDRAIALEVYARQAKNSELEADAAELRVRAERRIGELMLERAETIGLAKGGEQYKTTGVSNTPVVPTLAGSGVDKNLAKRARRAARFTPEQFEGVVIKTRNTANAGARAVKQASKKAEREDREQQLGTKIKAFPNERFGVIYADPATKFEVHSERELDRSADNHYPTQTLDEIKAMPIGNIAAPDCLLLLWTTVPMLANSIDILRHWGFEYKSMLTWDKIAPATGYWFMNRTEHLIVATRGRFVAPGESQRPSSLFIERKTDHSKKPGAIADWIIRTWPDVPRIELYARGPRDGFAVWGNETEPPVG